MSERYSAKQVVLVGTVAFFLGTAVRLWPPVSNAVGAEHTQPTTIPPVASGDGSRANIKAAEDAGGGGQLMFSTRGSNGILTEKLRLTKDGALAVGARVDPDVTHGMARGTMNVIIDDPSRPGAFIMVNAHEAAKGVGATLAWYASGHGQVHMISSWLGETRRVAQTHNRPLPDGYSSSDYPGPTSASRMEIGLRVNDWESLAAMFEPIADDGRTFVTIDREHPYLGQVEYLDPGGEWINNRRIGRHALIIGTTHTTGATAGGVVLAGDSYHEYQGKGPVIKSPNGTAFRIIVDDNGKLSTEKFE